MTHRPFQTGNADAPSKALGLLAQAEFETAIQVGSGYFEHLILLDGCPDCAYIRVSADHREQMELTLAAVLFHLRNHSVETQPDAHGRIFQDSREFEPAETFTRVFHLRSLNTAFGVAAETPQLGHATYLFAKPASTEAFLALYITVTKEDIRRNRDNLAARLGFLGRIVHGTNPRAWLKDLRARFGEAVDYAQADG